MKKEKKSALLAQLFGPVPTDFFDLPTSSPDAAEPAETAPANVEVCGTVLELFYSNTN